MSISRALRRLCPQTVNIAPATSNNSYGEDSYGADVQYQCLIEKKPRMVRNAEGKEVVSSAAVYLTSVPALTLKDRLTLPDGSRPQIITIGTWANTKEDYFSVLFC